MHDSLLLNDISWKYFDPCQIYNFKTMKLWWIHEHMNYEIDEDMHAFMKFLYII